MPFVCDSGHAGKYWMLTQCHSYCSLSLRVIFDLCCILSHTGRQRNHSLLLIALQIQMQMRQIPFFNNYNKFCLNKCVVQHSQAVKPPAGRKKWSDKNQWPPLMPWYFFSWNVSLVSCFFQTPCFHLSYNEIKTLLTRSFTLLLFRCTLALMQWDFKLVCSVFTFIYHSHCTDIHPLVCSRSSHNELEKHR